jgi:polyhydroxybutyrate depolymerase
MRTRCRTACARHACHGHATDPSVVNSTALAPAPVHVQQHGGVQRRFRVVAPGSFPGVPPRLVVDLHGSGFGADDQMRVSGSPRFARRGAVVVLPEAAIPFTLQPGWPAGFAWNVPGSPLPGEDHHRDGPDDVAFVAAVIAEISSRFGVPAGRVHVMGHSGGARLASHLAARLPGITSVGLVAGARFPPVPQWWPAVLAIHGRADEINPYAGGLGPRWDVSVPDSIARWAAGAGCGPEARARQTEPGVTEHRYERSDGTSPVRLLALDGVGHAWPGSRDPAHASRFGAPGRFDASEALWDFFCESR